MENYKIISDEEVLDKFITSLPELLETEVYYICLFGRHKYCPSFPNTRDSGQLARVISKKSDIKEKLLRLQSPVGSYSRDGHIAPQECLATYIGLNPRSLVKANKLLLVEMAEKFAKGETCFNPITLATTQVHKAVDRKFFVDFDFDNVEPKVYLENIQKVLPEGSFRILKTRGGFHLIVTLSDIKNAKTDWYKHISGLIGCDVKGSNCLTPMPGCIQGGFTPHFI